MISVPGIWSPAREASTGFPRKNLLILPKAYSLPAIRQSQSVPRWRRLRKLLAENVPLDFPAVKSIFRDYFEGELIEPWYGACYSGFSSICMHARSWDASQTAASLLYTWQDCLGNDCRCASSLPCTSVYLPVY